MSNVIFDASALLALIKDEPIKLNLEEFLGDICMSSVNVSEVAGILLESKMSYKECKNLIEPLITSIIDFDQKQSFLAADLKKQTEQLGLSLGGRACLALGLITGYPIYTADKIWAKLQLNCEIILIR